MSDQKLRKQRINSKLRFHKLPAKLDMLDSKLLGSTISNFIHFVFLERSKSVPLNWVFANIKRTKIFLQIFHANQTGKEIYKEEIAKHLSEYSYKTIAKIVDDGIVKEYFVLLPPDGVAGNDAKVKNIRPSEELITDFLNLSIDIISYIDKHKPKKLPK
ncbi:MAG: hypothetical protein ISQ92_03555 [Pelagibacteraceae bacterium]|jgi:hypothetical protein|nr:hypothetical protein [Pelagibacteraceae bacterium]